MGDIKELHKPSNRLGVVFWGSEHDGRLELVRTEFGGGSGTVRVVHPVQRGPLTAGMMT